MKTIVRINIDSTMNDLELNIENKSIVNTLNKNSNNRGMNNIRHLYTWINNKDTIRCYGWYDGDEEYINKHELIPNGSSKFLDEDSSTILLYGDIFLLAFDDKNRIKDFDISAYGLYHSIIHEGIDDCLTDDSEDSEPDTEEEDPDYDTDCDSEDDNDFEIISSDENELQIDENNY
tara:strand:+ start:1315 stop:1842 length:528 start_codon:yes stop_codon:yes gene_type:complete